MGAFPREIVLQHDFLHGAAIVSYIGACFPVTLRVIITTEVLFFSHP
jgi:hypothetical protein